MTMTVEEKLGKLRYNFDKEPHILVKLDICSNCNTKQCILGCPASCFKLVDGQLQYQYEDCIECGTCKILCNKGAIEWKPPRGTFGVAFRYG